MRAAAGTYHCKPTGGDLSKALGAQPSHPCALDVGQGFQKDDFGAVGLNDWPAGFWTFMYPAATRMDENVKAGSEEGNSQRLESLEALEEVRKMKILVRVKHSMGTRAVRTILTN
ncbi:uncharacterized protein LOC134759791 isoform X3 [Pongo abelii]|uniref:uncharacterized protein LOC134759791 isoform X3 n=1 Tax=Pongo abelii TaxID=9601 RepID=UPI003004EE85